MVSMVSLQRTVYAPSQRKYGLKVDGIAGPRVMEVLKDSQLQNGSVLQGIWGCHSGRCPE